MWALELQARTDWLLETVRSVEPQVGSLVESAEEYRWRQQVLPTGWPADATLTSGYGYRRSPFTRRWKFHSGVDLASYYGAIAHVMLPHLAGRPVTMERYPSGIDQKGFFHKNVTRGFPEWLERVEVPKKKGTVQHPLVGDRPVQEPGKQVVDPIGSPSL